MFKLKDKRWSHGEAFYFRFNQAQIKNTLLKVLFFWFNFKMVAWSIFKQNQLNTLFTNKFLIDLTNILKLNNFFLRQPVFVSWTNNFFTAW